MIMGGNSGERRRAFRALALTRAILLLVGLWSLAPLKASASIPRCTVAAVAAMAPPGMSIGAIPNFSGKNEAALQSHGGVMDIPANDWAPGSPEFCLITGSVVTSRPKKTANFAAVLPATTDWNGKFMFQGCGGNCGVVPTPTLSLLRKGYPIFATDGGHISPPGLGGAMSANWAVAGPNTRDEERVTDFFYRATHAVTVAGKALVLAYYKSPTLRHAYFNGCSDGGRDAMVELDRFPDDFDGVIAGDPYFDIPAEVVNSLVTAQAQLRSADAALTPAQFRQVDKILDEDCDLADGVKDGLIQNPALCAFDPQTSLPVCSGSGCFSPDQVSALSIIFSAVTDPTGRVIYPGYPTSNVAEDGGAFADHLAFWAGFKSAPDQISGPEPWRRPENQPIAWAFANQTMRYLIYADVTGFDALKTPGITFEEGARASGGGLHAVIPQTTVDWLTKQTSAGNGDDPSAALAFFRRGHKLIMYHGYADGDITPYRTIQYYRALAKSYGGYDGLKESARLFMAPGMAHCSGGPGPNSFGQAGFNSGRPESDIVAALEAWVENGRAPASIVATKFEANAPSGAIQRSMPLCPFPAMARYSQVGDVNKAENWTCPVKDRGLLGEGKAGRNAGADADLN